jgi:2-polyprenyl-3-methyl-5-hydroxy-6-metoxy-1,4-benzoquinol methylase
MSDLPPHFIADVRLPRGYSDLDAGRWFQWRSIPMIKLSAFNTCQFVKSMLPQPAQTILEVGCGNGYLTLELARDGHAVTGIDLSADIIEVAERSKAAHPDTPGFGSLRYLCTDVNTWQALDASVDCVIFNRCLHHISDLPQTMVTMKRLLKPGGRIICQDYAYDRFDEQTACWLFQMQRLLFLSGHYDTDPATLPDEAASIRAMRTAWLTRSSEHHLNQYEEIISALHETCDEHYFAWVPYLFVYIGNGMRAVSVEQERELLTFLKRMEQYLIAHDAIQAVGFRFVGRANT